jgi:hypothetical protein
MTPYTYLIGWSNLNKFYYGAQWNKKSNPNDLMTKYFTSSKIVKHYIQTYGLPDIIKIRKIFDTAEKCKHWESAVLDHFLGDKRFLNIYNNLGKNQFNSTGKVTVRDSDGNIFMTSIDDPLYINGEFKHISVGYVVVFDPKLNKNIKILKTDHRFRTGKLQSPNKGKPTPNQRGKIWINNSSNNKYIYPSQLNDFIEMGWKRGKIQKQYINRDYSKNKSQLGTCWITHELIGPKKIKLDMLPLFLDQGWHKGRINPSDRR